MLLNHLVRLLLDNKISDEILNVIVDMEVRFIADEIKKIILMYKFKTDRAIKFTALSVLYLFYLYIIKKSYFSLIFNSRFIILPTESEATTVPMPTEPNEDRKTKPITNANTTFEVSPTILACP